MADTEQLQGSVSSTSQSCQSLIDVISALDSQHVFAPLTNQLVAFHLLLKSLQQTPTGTDTQLVLIISLIGMTSKFCDDIKGGLEQAVQSVLTEWSTFKCLDKDITSLTESLQIYTSTVGLGAITAAR